MMVGGRGGRTMISAGLRPLLLVKGATQEEFVVLRCAQHHFPNFSMRLASSRRIFSTCIGDCNDHNVDYVC